MTFSRGSGLKFERVARVAPVSLDFIYLFFTNTIMFSPQISVLPETPLWAVMSCSESRPSASPYSWEQTQKQGWQFLHTGKPPGWRRGWTHTAPDRQTKKRNMQTFTKLHKTCRSLRGVTTINCPFLRNISEFNYCYWMLTKICQLSNVLHIALHKSLFPNRILSTEWRKNGKITYQKSHTLNTHTT